MFFVLSKIIYPLLNPFIWVFIFLVWALFNKKNKRKIKLIIGIALFFIFGNQLISNLFMRGWEVKPTAIKKLSPHTYGVVLTGIANLTQTPKDRVYLNKGSDRIAHAYQLYKAGKINKIIITGGSGSIFDPEQKEGPLLKSLLINWGVPIRDIIMEDNSRNTHENAVEVGKILKHLQHTKKVVLITSSFHMKRAIGCFKKQQIPITPFATDFYSTPHYKTPDYWLIPSISSFLKWQILFKEWFGMMSYKFAGYI